MTSNEHPSMREKLLAKITSNQVRMHTRLFFILKIVGIIALSIAVLILSILIGNLVFFSLRVNGHVALLGLGGHGILLFVQVFPWWLFALDIVLIFLLERLLRQFKFGYRSPVLYVLLVLIAIAALGGNLIDQDTPVNDTLLHEADEGHLLPPLNALYQDSRRSPPPGSGIYRGTVAAIATTSLTIADPDHDGTTLTVILPTQGSAANQSFAVGETVLVVGNEDDGVVHAVDIHPIDPNGIPPQNDHAFDSTY